MRPDVDTFRDSISILKDIAQKEDRSIYMYCTGGIRCTKAGAILKSQGVHNLIAVTLLSNK